MLASHTKKQQRSAAATTCTCPFCGLLCDDVVVSASGSGAVSVSARAEVRNRADVLVVIGTDVVSRFPRFFERIAAPGGTLFGLQDGDRRSIFVGAQPPSDAPGRTDWIACERPELPDVLGALAALTAGVRLDATRAGSVPIERLRELSGLMQSARYGALVWAAADLDFAHAELSVQAIQ